MVILFIQSRCLSTWLLLWLSLFWLFFGGWCPCCVQTSTSDNRLQLQRVNLKYFFPTPVRNFSSLRSRVWQRTFALISRSRQLSHFKLVHPVFECIYVLNLLNGASTENEPSLYYVINTFIFKVPGEYCLLQSVVISTSTRLASTQATRSQLNQIPNFAPPSSP